MTKSRQTEEDEEKEEEGDVLEWLSGIRFQSN